MDTIPIEFKLPGTIRTIWDKLIVKGIYISSDNERELWNDILRNEDDIKKFLDIFDHKLTVHNKDFIFAEDKRNARLLKNHEQLIVFLAVFFEKYQKLNANPAMPWYSEIVISTQNLNKMNLYSTETAERRLSSVGLDDELDIVNKVFKTASMQGLIQLRSKDLIDLESAEQAKLIEFKFNAPIYRFIDMFAELAETGETEIKKENNNEKEI